MTPTDPQEPGGSGPSPALLSALRTEHSTLQAQRSSTIVEANGRGQLFLSAVSGATVALARPGRARRLLRPGDRQDPGVLPLHRPRRARLLAATGRRRAARADGADRGPALALAPPLAHLYGALFADQERRWRRSDAGLPTRFLPDGTTAR